MLITAIMPTANRRRFIPQAIACFQAQDCKEKELVVLDDGTDSVRDLCDAADVYVYTAGPLTTGAKRNLCCEMAHGDIIIHWDDDDWSAPGRMTEQVGRLLASGKDVTGYYSTLFYDERTGRAYKFTAGRRERYALGTSLCYRKSFWRTHPFTDKQIGEDNEFFTSAQRMNRVGVPVISVDGGDMIVARIHSEQTSRKAIDHPEFRPIPASAIPAGFFA